ncbi:MAG: glucokinase [Saccharospirillaceae bacterium]|nr:glucokinase [Pseudomonadales bacterium]NRB80220.1 glucokinase [Saccharospirillaceae bacterium]
MIYGLIADIGGTNARFALAPIKPSAHALRLDESEIVEVMTLNCKKYEHISDAIENYLSQLPEKYTRPTQACLAIACPTEDDWIQMTNHSWAFSVKELKKSLKFKVLNFINDYHALANSILFLGEHDSQKVGGGESIHGKPMVVTGPGTGLGLGSLVFENIHPTTVCTEGGHSSFAPDSKLELEILSYLMDKFGRVSNERLISGQGLENIYEALTFIRNGEATRLTAPEISNQALDQTDKLCEEALEVFCSVLGTFAGDAALMYGAKGGIYIAGGIIPRFLEYFEKSKFRASFENKARFSEYNSGIPTYVILNDQPGLLGSAAVLNYEAH